MTHKEYVKKSVANDQIQAAFIATIGTPMPINDHA